MALCSNRSWHGDVKRLSSSIIALLVAELEMIIPSKYRMFYNLSRLLNGIIGSTVKSLAWKN